MKDPIIINFKDLDTADKATVIVRYDDSSVVLGLSLNANGDLQVVMNKEDATKIILALQKATER